MRFRFETDDGTTGDLLDKGKVISRGLGVERVNAAIVKRMAGDAWRSAIRAMLRRWRGHQNQFSKESNDEWEIWIQTRIRSFNDRAKAVRRCIEVLGTMKIKPASNRLICSGFTEHQLSKMRSAWKAGKDRYDNPWQQWASNTASNHRKRMRRKEEKQSQREETERDS